ncbi:MAG: GNAT family N-acetyltransferase [Amaricoccus sp.]|uniref:GNAT family N-acetyltransferase n=1 Tax=Amaricoccus sp. TaxID=1872485 RepID=UPI0033160FF4
MVRAACRWAATEGAATLALAVGRANLPAVTLYQRLGMAEAGAYHYRVAAE